jgi:hypothetical protein
MKVKNSQNIKNTNFYTNPIGTQCVDLCEDILVGEIIKIRTKKRQQNERSEISKMHLNCGVRLQKATATVRPASWG